MEMPWTALLVLLTDELGLSLGKETWSLDPDSLLQPTKSRKGLVRPVVSLRQM